MTYKLGSITKILDCSKEEFMSTTVHLSTAFTVLKFLFYLLLSRILPCCTLSQDRLTTVIL